MYYIFNNTLETAIAQAMSQAQGTGFYDFKPHQKCEKVTAIPNSNTDSTPIRSYRTVFVLETNFAVEDAILKAQAEELAEFYSNDSFEIHNYLNTPDVN